jgi:hypothetical protein
MGVVSLCLNGSKLSPSNVLCHVSAAEYFVPFVELALVELPLTMFSFSKVMKSKTFSKVTKIKTFNEVMKIKTFNEVMKIKTFSK